MQHEGAVTLRFTRLSPTHHRFEAIRGDGTHWMRDLETESLLRHDLVHFALESEAQIRGGFFGRLARGDDDEPEELNGEALAIERVVGALQGHVR